jgi:hypothetical protein
VLHLPAGYRVSCSSVVSCPLSVDMGSVGGTRKTHSTLASLHTRRDRPDRFHIGSSIRKRRQPGRFARLPPCVFHGASCREPAVKSGGDLQATTEAVDIASCGRRPPATCSCRADAGPKARPPWIDSLGSTRRGFVFSHRAISALLPRVHHFAGAFDSTRARRPPRASPSLDLSAAPPERPSALTPKCR